MALSNIIFFGYEFRERIGWHLPSFVPKLWMFAAAIAAVALVVMVAEIVISAKRYEHEQSHSGNILLSVFSLLFALWTMSESGLLEEYLHPDGAVMDVVNYSLFMLMLIAFVGYAMLFYFGERPIIGISLMLVMVAFAATALILDALSVASLCSNVFGMSIFTALLLVVLLIIAFVRLIQTGSSKYVLYMVSLVLVSGIVAFNAINESVKLAEDYFFDYRLAVDGYLLILMIYGFATIGKKETRTETNTSENDAKELTNTVFTSDDNVPNWNPTIVEINRNEETVRSSKTNAPEVQQAPIKVDVEIPATPVPQPITQTEAVPEQESSLKPETLPEPEAILEPEAVPEQAKEKEPKRPAYSPHYTDFLTEVRNRLYFMDQLNEIKAEEANDKNLAIVVFDVDNLRIVNENRGYAEGDQMLRLAATVISQSFADVGECARIDGDEFAVLIRDTKPGIISQRLLIMLEALKQFNEKSGESLSIDFGYAVFSGRSQLNVEALLRMAEKRMLEKKNQR